MNGFRSARSRLSHLMVAIFAWALTCAAGAVPTAAQAYTPQTGAQGWCTSTLGGGGAFSCFGSPAAACQTQFQSFAIGVVGPGNAVFDGFEAGSGWQFKQCKWHYISPYGGPAPGIVQFNCDYGFKLNLGGFCEADGYDYQYRPQHCSLSGGGSQQQTANPISLLTGAKRFNADDFMSADGGLHLSRTFISKSYGGVAASVVTGNPSGLGNWLFDFLYELQIPDAFATSQTVTLLSPRGGGYTFTKQTSGALLSDGEQSNQQVFYKLELVGAWPADPRTAKTYWKMTDSDDGVWELESFANPVTGKYTVARPITHTTRAGLVRTFDYTAAGLLNQVTDSYGKVITFIWSSPTEDVRAITQANLPGGYKMIYAYGAATGSLPERLLSATLQDASNTVLDKTSYDYDNATFPSFVTGIRDRDNVLRWSATYDARGRATSSTAPASVDSTTVAYSADGDTFTRSVTNALGKVAIYNFGKQSRYEYNVKFNGVTGVASTNCPSSATSTTYGSDKLISSTTDEEGRVSKYTWDSRGLPLQTVEGFGTASARTLTRTWHANFRVPTQIVEPKATTNFTYDTLGRPLTQTVTDTTSYTTPYATNARTRTWTYGWTSTGQLASVDGPLAGSGDTRSWTYNSNGYLQTSTNELGHVTTVTAWDWRGNPTTIVDANSVTTNLTYDMQGRVLSTTLNPGGTQSQYQFTYSAMGDVTRITLPRGGYLDYTYDNSRRLTLVTNNRGETITLTPNVYGQPTLAVTKNASATITRQQGFAYDELARVIQAVGAGSQTTTFGYDKVDNPTTLVDARSKTFSQGFDALDRVISETNPETHVVRYDYDAADKVTSHKDGRTLETTMVVDGFGQVIQESSPDRGVRSYWYDAAGRMNKLVDGDGEETNYTYDAAGRRLTATFPGAAWETITYTYDSTAGGNKGVGRLTGVAEESGSTNLKYDAQGRLLTDTKVIQGETYVVAYQYDTNGKVTQITLPSGRIITMTRATDGLVTAVSTKPTSTGAVQNIATSVAYQPFGPLKQLTYGNGLALTRTHDQNYWLTGTKASATGANRLDLTFSRNANGQLDGVTDNAATGRSASFGYHDSGRLQYGVGPWGDHSYAYDAAGNRTDFRTVTGGVVSYEFAVNSGSDNRVTLVADTNGNPLRNLQYRDGGDLYEDARVGGATYQYYYNARKRLVAANKNGVDQAYYAYDWRNQRIARQILVPTYSATHYIYDQQGHLLAEHNGSTGAVIKQYIWLDDMPLAVIDKSSGTEVVYYIHTGQMDEPLVMTNASKAKVWDAYVEPFGRAQVFGTASANIDLRLPGQWAQLETGGLSQNWNRDYDPTLARYVQADPIGLGGGHNVYAYVEGDPLNTSDPSGLWPNFYGNWGGPGWSNGQRREEAASYMPKPGDPGYRWPIDSQDACYERHDRCINNVYNPPGKGVCLILPKRNNPGVRQCDYSLSKCLKNNVPEERKTVRSELVSWGFERLIPSLVH